MLINKFDRLYILILQIKHISKSLHIFFKLFGYYREDLWHPKNVCVIDGVRPHSELLQDWEENGLIFLD